ncbi:outer membrane efflux protein [Idiomarina aquatica]|uniref:Outer membrane efflux protein n=1 Tax=Idiomarina aquatica TaxID=1327752 RepID=A0A4R6PIX0_9GAMM|nr:TolC family protein [Idiomarina aquatica]TDP38334.1 outer membrane efflux protein [Idiomarina aquatica]
MSLFRVIPGKLFFSLLAVAVLLLSLPTQANNPPQQTLLQSTVERLKTDGMVIATDFGQRRWLSSTPRLNLMHWQTNADSFGANETELVLELEFLNPAQRRLVHHSEQLIQQYQQLQNLQLKLTASGVIRELFWQAKQLRTELAYAEQVVNQLRQLQRQTQSLVEAGERPAYAGIIVTQQQQTAQSQVAEKQIALQQIERLWQQLTGFNAVPTSLDEPEQAQHATPTHPELQRLQLQWQLALNATQQSIAAEKSWGVNAGYKYIDAPNQSENQWGLGFSLPLSFSQSLNASELVGLQQQQNELNQSLRQTQIRLELDIVDAQSQLAQLKQQHQSNRQNAKLSQQAIEQLNNLYQQGQIDTRLYIDRLLEQLSYQHAAQLSQIQVKQAQAFVNQAKGITL